MINANKKSTVSKKRDRREFSLDEKQELCKKWLDSGLNKSQFCKQHDLVLSAFSKWCRQLLPEEAKAPRKGWIPVVLKGQSHQAKRENITVEIILPNQMAMRLSLELSCLNALLKELCHAAPVIR